MLAMPDDKAQENGAAAEAQQMPFREFLEECPPGRSIVVTDALVGGVGMQPVPNYLAAPEIQLYCSTDCCKTTTFFDAEVDQFLPMSLVRVFLAYKCRNCLERAKTYALAVTRLDGVLCEAFKYGENPPFGPPIPPRALTLIGTDRALFLQGYRSENQGFGIGALGYYRRVVENQWARLVDHIVKGAKAIGASKETLADLESLANQNQFAKAVASVKDAVPQSLRIDGHNPLTLLHSALSEAVHELSDDECLQTARSIRVVLFELAESLAQALKNKREIKDAVSRLLHRQKPKAGDK